MWNTVAQIDAQLPHAGGEGASAERQLVPPEQRNEAEQVADSTAAGGGTLGADVSLTVDGRDEQARGEIGDARARPGELELHRDRQEAQEADQIQHVDR